MVPPAGGGWDWKARRNIPPGFSPQPAGISPPRASARGVRATKSACKGGCKMQRYPYTRRFLIWWQHKTEPKSYFKDKGIYGILFVAVPDFRLCRVVSSPYAGLMCYQHISLPRFLLHLEIPVEDSIYHDFCFVKRYFYWLLSLSYCPWQFFKHMLAIDTW